MSFPMPAIFAAIRDRLMADTGAGGLVNADVPLVTGVYFLRAPASAAAPYIVIRSPRGSAPHEGFGTSSRTREIAVEYYVQTAPALEYDPVARAFAIQNRIEGDWDEQAGGAPTYGLNRWHPTLTGASGWEADIVEYREDGEFEADPSTMLAFAVLFDVTVSRVQG